MVSLCKVHDTKDFWFLTTYLSKHFSYVRYRPAGISVALYHTSTYVLTYGQYVTMPTDPRSFYGYAHVYGSVSCTADASWPIPNIAEMLRRIGSQKPKIFGIMDLTQGYHQAPLTFATRAYTAFITFSGVYQFARLPFEPKRAPRNHGHCSTCRTDLYDL